MKRGDIIRVPDEHNAFNRRNGLPKYRAQEVVAVLEPGERACDYGIHGRVYGYLNDGEQRVALNNDVAGRVNRDLIFWPLRHDAPEPAPSEYATVSYTTTGIAPRDSGSRAKHRDTK